ncbi:MAG: hypothetical protein GTO42_02680 [Candidatus Latescibacteria bacterium]|nr:hypothetical protein [Candidatus Latescibacterota bacterium]NIO01043.1 hypothetical protein [Candidatus Latescibacterota bacterium]NIO27442.1 hypothetical protein [Candidatus Latescibacterota bacterium]NIO54964.1 hypothetical protein [Candidatus Latescibacterota bacterium]NIT01053.1 hypothetical protein [Candidatus Latescibacterota bacterium]
MLRRKLEGLRYRGYGGGIIYKHRALLTSPRELTKIIPSAILPLLMFVGWLYTLNWVSLAWAHILDFWRAVLGLGGYITTSYYHLGDFYKFSVPYLHITSDPPDYFTLLLGGLATVLVLLITFVIPRRYLPIIYLVRVAVFFHACAQIFFAFIPVYFPYGASGYIHGMLIAGLFLIALVPILLGFTYFIFDFNLAKKLLLTLLMMLHLSILIPVQYMAHAYILHHMSLLFLPILFFVFGLPFQVMTFIAFYSWGSSWRGALDGEQFRQEKEA